MPSLSSSSPEKSGPVDPAKSDEYRREKITAHRALNQFLSEVSAKAQANKCTWDEASDPKIRSAMRDQANDAWGKTESRQKERGLMILAIEAVQRERQRQIACMVTAMNQFVEALHQDG